MLEVIDGFEEQRPDHVDKGDIFTLEDASLRAVQGSKYEYFKNNTVALAVTAHLAGGSH